jgi:hypothetical protein
MRRIGAVQRGIQCLRDIALELGRVVRGNVGGGRAERSPDPLEHVRALEQLGAQRPLGAVAECDE